MTSFLKSWYTAFSFYGWIFKTWRVKTMGTCGKINAIWWNIKINLQKLVDIMWIWIANRCAKFHEKRLNLSENIPKSFRELLFWNTLYSVKKIIATRKHVHTVNTAITPNNRQLCDVRFMRCLATETIDWTSGNVKLCASASLCAILRFACDIMACEHFRGIAISPVIAKVFEYCFLQKFGFKKAHSLVLKKAWVAIMRSILSDVLSIHLLIRTRQQWL